MTKFIKNLEQQTQSVLLEGLADDAAELTGVSKDVVADAVKGLSYANYLELGNAIDLDDAESAREILGTVADLVPGDDIDLEEEQGDLDLEDHVDMQDQQCRECGKGHYTETSIHDDWDGVLHCSECGSATKRHMRQFSDGSLTEGSGDFGLLTPEEMQGLPTPRLLAYYKAKRKEHKQNTVKGDWDIDSEYLDEIGKTIAIAKGILNTREHLGEDMFDEEKLLDKPTPTLKDLAKKHDMSLGDMGSQLAKGIKIEKEHTSDMLVAKEIALDHLNELPDYYDRLQKMEEADNPSAPAPASPSQPAVTPPSAGSSIDAMAKPAETAADVGKNEMEQGRKAVDDLRIGDEIEVADIDGQPAAGRIRNPNGPGDTIVITGKGNEEHMIRKDSILSTPMVDVGPNGVQEEVNRLKDELKAALNEADRTRAAQADFLNIKIPVSAKSKNTRTYLPRSIRAILKDHGVEITGKTRVSAADDSIFGGGGVVVRISGLEFPNKGMGMQKLAKDIYDKLNFAGYNVEDYPTFVQSGVNVFVNNWGEDDTPKWKMEEGWIEDMEAESAETAAFNEREWAGLGFKRHGNWPGGETFVATGDARKAVLAKFKQEGWKKTAPEGGLSWWKHPTENMMSVYEPKPGTITSMQIPSYMANEARNASNTEHAGAKKGKGGYYGRKKDADKWVKDNAKGENLFVRKVSKAVKEGWPQEETYAEMVEYWKQSLSSSIVRKGVFTQMYDAAGQDIDELNAAIADEAESIAERYHGSGEGIGSSDQNHFIASIARQLGIDDVFGWRKPKESNNIRDLEGLDKHLALAHGMASDEEMERDKAVRGMKASKAIRNAESIEEAKEFSFYVEPDGRGGGSVMTSDGDVHDYYDDVTDARQEAERLNNEYGQVNEGVDPMDVGRQIKKYDTVTLANGESGEVEHIMDRSFLGQRAAKCRAFNTGAGYEYFYVPLDDDNRIMGYNEDLVAEELAEMQRRAGIQINEIKSGRFNSKAIGNSVKIIGQDHYGNDEYNGKIGTIINAEREPTFSQMVPFKTIYGIELEDGTKVYARRENIRKVKGIKETASAGGCAAGGIASAPAAMNGMQSRNPSIYGQTKLRKKPAPKKRATSEDAGDGVGRSKKK